jgi:hypothetical protein
VRRHRDTGLIRRSPAAMRQLLFAKTRAQDNHCAECHKEFEDAREIEPDHIKPRGFNGAFRDDSDSNIRAVCHDCNQKKGSKRIPPEEAA